MRLGSRASDEDAHCLLYKSNRPRWLYSVGKTQEAREILARFHSSTGDINSPLIDLEMKEIEEKIEVDGVDSAYSASVPQMPTAC